VSIAARNRRIPPVILVAIAVAWIVAVIAQATGNAGLLHGHDHWQEHGYPLWVVVLLPPFWVTVVVFLLAWQVMIAAMMLPSSLPMIRLFVAASARQSHAGRVRLAFLAGYALVWSGFGAAAFLADVVLHHAVGGVPWLAARPWVVSGSVLVAAGAFQFSSLKDRCLEQCRHPGPFLMRHYRRGIRGGYALGREHGVFCLGCCWALMLLMFTAGLVSLLWMAALAAVMYYEKAGRHGPQLVPLIGVLLLAWGTLVLLHPAWLPHLLAGAAS
jgi:predicted metal-binding membrane protein